MGRENEGKSAHPNLVSGTAAAGRSERDPALDFMRAVAIVLVVLGHAQRGLVDAGALKPDQTLYQVYLLSDYAMYTFHVPAFFVVSGFLLEARRNSTNSAARRILSLVGLYLIWNTLNGIPAALFSDLINRNGRNVWSFFDPLQPSGIMWFFVALIAAHIAYLMVRRIVLLRYAVMAAALTALSLGIDHLGIAYGCLWFFAGVELQRTKMPDRLPPSATVIAASLAVFILATAICYQLGVPTTAAFISCTAALACLYAVGQLVGAQPMTALLGRETLAIYVMHVVAAAGVRILMLKALGLEGSNLYPLVLLTVTAAGLLLPLLAAYGARRLGVSRFLLLDQPMGGKARHSMPEQARPRRRLETSR